MVRPARTPARSPRRPSPAEPRPPDRRSAGRSTRRTKARPAAGLGDSAPERILAAALAAFAERGFQAATTREIAAAAGVPQGLVTYHYASKLALWEAAADWIFAAFRSDLDGAVATLGELDPASRLRAVMKHFARFVARHPELHCFMTHEGSHDGPRLRWLTERHVRPLFDFSTAMIREALPRADAAQLHYALVGAIAHLFAVAPEFARVTGRDARSADMVDAHADVVVDALIDGALARQGIRRSPSARRNA